MSQVLILNHCQVGANILEYAKGLGLTLFQVSGATASHRPATAYFIIYEAVPRGDGGN